MVGGGHCDNVSGMRRTLNVLSPFAAVVAMTAAVACGSSEPGPTPDASMSGIGGACIPSPIPPGGLSSSESYFGQDDTACGDDWCVAHMVAGDPSAGCVEGCADPADVAERIFCTCRCGGDPSLGPLCECPMGMTCGLEVGLGPVPGSYCLRDGL